MATAETANLENESDQAGRAAGACAMVLFGAAGDLTKRKLVPALFNLVKAKLLPKDFAVLGVSVDDLTLEQFRAQVTGFLPAEDRGTENWQWFVERLFYQRGEFSNPETYTTLASRLNDLDRDRHTAGNYMFYLATSPKFFGEIVQRLGTAGLTHEENGGWRRVIIEKPFGHDLESANVLNDVVRGVFDEKSVYRIDHYLGKETVQNILVFRFSNSLFEPVWNRNYIERVEITAAETVGLENRAAFYEETGALRDMVANHLLQLLALTAMEPPVAFDADSVREQKVQVFRSIRPMSVEDVERFTVRGQYGPGVIDGSGYRATGKSQAWTPAP